MFGEESPESAAVSKHEEMLRTPQYPAFEKDRGRSSSSLESENNPTAKMSHLQKTLLRIIITPRYECLLGVVVLFNVILMIIDTDSALRCQHQEISCTPMWVQVMDYILLLIYTGDVTCVIFARRREFFRSCMNWLDLGIVLLGYLELCVMLASQGQGNSLLSMLRMCRIARLVRISKLLKPLPELYNLVTGFLFTLRAIFWGFVMLVLLLICWSIIILQALMTLDVKGVFNEPPFAGYWCEEAVQSTTNMILLLWQTLVVGDSWGACSLPVILKHPAMYWVYAAAFVCINIGFTNLILAVIVENAQHQREDEVIRRLLERRKQQQRDIENFKETFEELDVDESGTLSLAEMMAGFDSKADFKRDFQKFGIDRCDLHQIFTCLDLDRSGDVSYMEFVAAMFRSQRQEADTQLMMIQIGIKKLLSSVEIILERLSPKSPKSSSTTNGNMNTGHSLDSTTEVVVGFVGELETETCRETKVHLGLPKDPANGKDLEDLGQIRLESLEHCLQTVAGALQQQSLLLTNEMHELQASLARMRGTALQLNEEPMSWASTGHHGSNGNNVDGGQQRGWQTVRLDGFKQGQSDDRDRAQVPVELKEDDLAVEETLEVAGMEGYSKSVCCSLIQGHEPPTS